MHVQLCVKCLKHAELLNFQQHFLPLYSWRTKSLLDSTIRDLDWKTLLGIQYVRACHQMKLILKNACYDCC